MCHVQSFKSRLLRMSALQFLACFDGFNTLQHDATRCNMLQHAATHIFWSSVLALAGSLHCNTLQHTATHCNTLQYTATHYNTLQYTTTHCNTLQHTATHGNTVTHHVYLKVLGLLRRFQDGLCNPRTARALVSRQCHECTCWFVTNSCVGFWERVRGREGAGAER